MTYGSVCSGIEAASCAWHPLGWTAAWFAEIEAFPSAVLAARYPKVPNRGDFTKIKDKPGAIDLLVGGTPCQSFSVAGLRKGLDDPRGNLALEYLALAERLRCAWLVWENVPGVLSSDEGRAFGAFLGALGKLGYGFAYRVLDAQYFGLAQRRKRVFVVGYLGDWRRAAAVLFERAGLSGHPAPRREAGEGTAGTLTPGAHPGGYNGQDAYTGKLIAPALKARDCKGPSSDGDGDGAPLVVHSLRAEGFDASEDGTGRGTPLIAFSCKDHGNDVQNDIAPTLRSMGHDKSHANAGGQLAVAYAIQERAVSESTSGPAGKGFQEGLAYTIEARNRPQMVASQSVRRLTPRECERLQGFPDDYTLIQYRGKPAADGPRYRALGNSMAVPVMRWIGERIEMVEKLARATA